MSENETPIRFETFRDPAISVWQSAVAATEARHRARTMSTLAAEVPVLADQSSPMLQATARAAAALTGTTALAGSGPALMSESIVETVDHCARAYLALAVAEARGNAAAITAARAELMAFGGCDLRWRDALEEFLLHYSLSKHGDVPYRRWTALDDFVLPDPKDPAPPAVLPEAAKVAVFGDWGTGEPRAQALLRAVARHEPDVVIHLGDIYYSCDLREADAFFRNIRAVFPAGSARVFTLCGNHDMYGGGAPYYALLNRLGQPASFFCLRNAHWQLLAMDTGYNDFNPFKVTTTETWVQDGTDEQGQPIGGYSELDWHIDKLSHAQGRRTVLLSHHPLFSRKSPIGEGRVRNERLYAQLQAWLPDIALWLWGHEHNQVVYAPFSDLARGRCLGAGAIPVPAADRPYDPSPSFAPGETVPELEGDPSGPPDRSARLAVDQETGVYELGYGLLTLAGAAGRMSYYGFSEANGARPVWEEQL